MWDAVYGEICLGQIARRVLSQPVVQRLGLIRQLGTTFRRFPSANHNRLQHSLGVYSRTRRVLEGFRRRQPKLFEPFRDSERIIEVVAVGGLLHDVGHFPCSHLFDQTVAPSLGLPDHEARGLRIARSLFQPDESPNHDPLSSIPNRGALRGLVNEAELAVVESVMDGSTHRLGAPVYADTPAGRRVLAARHALFQPSVLWDARLNGDAALLRLMKASFGWMSGLVHNRAHGIDTDKLDYLLRDALHLGLPRSPLSTHDHRNPHAIVNDANYVAGAACNGASGIWQRRRAAFEAIWEEAVVVTVPTDRGFGYPFSSPWYRREVASTLPSGSTLGIDHFFYEARSQTDQAQRIAGDRESAVAFEFGLGTWTTLHDVYRARAELYRDFYQHPDGLAIDAMVADVLHLVAPVLRGEALPTDGVVWDAPSWLRHLPSSLLPAATRDQILHILRRIDRGSLYRLTPSKPRDGPHPLETSTDSATTLAGSLRAAHALATVPRTATMAAAPALPLFHRVRSPTFCALTTLPSGAGTWTEMPNPIHSAWFVHSRDPGRGDGPFRFTSSCAPLYGSLQIDYEIDRR